MKHLYLDKGGSVMIGVTDFDVMLSGGLKNARLVAMGGGEQREAAAGARFHVPVEGEGVTLQIQSLTGTPFPSEARASVILEPLGMQERITLDGLDVGGHSVVEAAGLRIVSGQTRIDVLGSSEVQVPAMTRRAQLVTASQLGIRGNKLRSSESVDIAVGIDGTASMRPWLRNGGLAGVLQVIAGIDLVIGRDEEVDFRICGSKSAWARSKAMEVSEHLELGFDDLGPISEVDLWTPPPPAGRCHFVLTDHWPHSVPVGVDLVIVLCGEGAGRVLTSIGGDPRVCAVEMTDLDEFAVQLDDGALDKLVAAALVACQSSLREGSRR